MRFFKYLLFLLISFFSLNLSASDVYKILYESSYISASTASEVCQSYVSKRQSDNTNTNFEWRYSSNTETSCRFHQYLLKSSSKGPDNSTNIIKESILDECWHPDYKIVSQDVNNSQIKKSICVPNGSAICKYTTNPTSLKNASVVNGYITTTFDSVSKTPDPNCKEELVNPPCDPKDPYGGCYTPPNQECTRQFDGSIVCPEDNEPPIEKGCKGADYCKRPPEGCGEGYVSGTWNGERICIKTSPSTGDNTGGSGSDGDGSGSGGDGSGSGGLPVTPDLSGVINAIKNIGSKLDHYSKEIIESIDSMSKKITGKLDTSNGHLENIESNTAATKNNTAQTNDLLQQILDKPQSGDPSTGEAVDLSETNGLLGEIRDGINDIKNIFSDEGKAELEQIGQPSNDSRYTNAQANAQSSINALANKLTFSSSACLSDFQIQLPIFGSVNIALSQWCGLLALVKILFQLVVLLTCLRMLDATVRTI